MAADEAPADEVVRSWVKQHGEGIVPEREPGADRNHRAIYGWTDLYDADAGSHKKPECSKGTKERWERECIRGLDISTYAIDGCDAECIQESVYKGILLLKKNEQQPDGDRGRFLQADDRKVTRTAASIAVAAEHCLNLQAGEFAEQQADRRRSGGKEPTCLR